MKDSNSSAKNSYKFKPFIFSGQKLMKCIKCQIENPPKARRCVRCDAPLPSSFGEISEVTPTSPMLDYLLGIFKVVDSGDFDREDVFQKLMEVRQHVESNLQEHLSREDSIRGKEFIEQEYYRVLASMEAYLEAVDVMLDYVEGAAPYQAYRQAMDAVREADRELVDSTRDRQGRRINLFSRRFRIDPG